MPDIRSSWDQAAAEGINWLTPSEAMVCAQVAHEVVEENPNSRIFSLGQSPAWIVKAIEKESNLFGLNIETGTIPFSFRLFELSEADGGVYSYKPILQKSYLEYDLYNYCECESEDLSPAFCPDPEVAINIFGAREYRNRLSAINLSPETIIDRFQKNETATTVMDFIESGRGMATFLYILFSWAKEKGKEAELREALNVRLYSNPDMYKDNGRAAPSHLKIAGFDPMSCACRDMENLVLDKLWNCEDEARIVPYYPPEHWYKEPPPPEGDPEIIKNTERVLNEAVVMNNLAPDLFFHWANKGSVVVDRVLANPPLQREQMPQRTMAFSYNGQASIKELVQ